MVLGLALSNNPGQGEQNTLDGGQGCCWIIVIVKLRSRSRSDEGQVRVRKVKETKDLDLRYTLFLVFTTTLHPPPETFSWLLRVLDKSDGPRMGWYDLGMVREG